MTGNLTITVIAGIFIWATKTLISHVIKRARFRKAILVDIQLQLTDALEQINASKELVEETLEVGKKVPFPISYSIDEYNFYSSVQKELPIYFSQSELVKVIKFYQAIWQLDVAINGLATTISHWERDGVNVSSPMHMHLKKRLSRIYSFYNCLNAREIQSFANLPDDYRQVKDAGTVVTKV